MTFSFKHFICLFFLLAFSLYKANATDIIRYVDSKTHPDPKQSYFVDLLTLALEASKTEFGDYQLRPEAIEMAQERTSWMLERNEFIDLTWRMTSKDLETKLQAIYFPILKGLMGYRIFIIRREDSHNYKSDISLNDLKRIHSGQGHNWPDTEILLSNGFNVTRGYDIYLLDMLKKSRFDYYPRALHEPWFEIENEPQLTVESNLMLKYPAPIFFFVNKENKRLSKRLTLGLNKLLDSGKFEQFFLTHSVTAGIQAKAKTKTRTVFELKNPLLSNEVKLLLTDKRLWINTQ